MLQYIAEIFHCPINLDLEVPRIRTRNQQNLLIRFGILRNHICRIFFFYFIETSYLIYSQVNELKSLFRLNSRHLSIHSFHWHLRLPSEVKKKVSRKIKNVQTRFIFDALCNFIHSFESLVVWNLRRWLEIILGRRVVDPGGWIIDFESLITFSTSNRELSQKNTRKGKVHLRKLRAFHSEISTP